MKNVINSYINDKYRIFNRISDEFNTNEHEQERKKIDKFLIKKWNFLEKNDIWPQIYNNLNQRIFLYCAMLEVKIIEKMEIYFHKKNGEITINELIKEHQKLIIEICKIFNVKYFEMNKKMSLDKIYENLYNCKIIDISTFISFNFTFLKLGWNLRNVEAHDEEIIQ